MRFYLLLSVLFGIFLFLQYHLFFETDGIRDVFHLKRALAQQAKISEKLKSQNEELIFQVKRMQNSHEATESRARNELGMIKKDEMFYQIVKKDRK